MSVIGWIIAGARDLPLGGPLGALIERAARCLPRRVVWRALGRGGAPRRADQSISWSSVSSLAFARSARPITMRWISLVPSKIV